MLTNDELRQIRDYLALYGKKDSQLPNLGSDPILDTDYIAIVRNNDNAIVQVFALENKFIEDFLTNPEHFSATIDDVPTNGSENLVRSDGIYHAIKDDGVIHTQQLADGSVTVVKLKDNSVAWNKLTEDVRTRINTAGGGGGEVRLASDWGDSTEYGITQKFLTEANEELWDGTVHTAEQVLRERQKAQVLTNIRNTSADVLTGKLGYKVIDGSKAFSTQVTEANTIYEVRNSFDLSSSLVMPANSILAFNGGIIKNANIVADNLLIMAKDEEKIFENVTITGTLKNWYVTPEWFGAVKDYQKYNLNPTDDTDAIQAALDCGVNVKFANYGMSYFTRGGLHIKTTYQTLYRDVVNVGTKGAPHGVITFYPEDDESTLFTIDSPAHDVYFIGLRINVLGNIDYDHDTESLRYRGIAISCIYDDPADKDILIRNCHFTSGKYQVDFHGRGCEFIDNEVGSCRAIIRANWDDAYQTGDHPAQCGQRGIRIQNNRLHSIASTDTYPAIYIKSGHAIGMVIQNNVWDNGRGVFLGANDELWNLIMTNNLIQLNAFNVSAMVLLKGGIYNSNISNNNFSNYRYYDEDAQEWKGYWANEGYPMEICDIHKSCKSLIFENNQCMLTNRFGILFSNCAVESSRFINNFFSYFRDVQSFAPSCAFYFYYNSELWDENVLGMNNTVVRDNIAWDTEEGYTSYILNTTHQFNAYNNVIEYNKAYLYDNTLMTNVFGGNIRCYDSVVSLDNGMTTATDMSAFIKTFNPYPVNNNGIVSWFDGTKWIDAMGYTSKKHSGTTSERPSLTSEDEGFPYYDKTLHKWLFYGASGWETFDGTALSV